MFRLYNITKKLILEQNSKITSLRQSILDKKPISIYYVGPYPDVLSGDRYEIAPIVMGKNAKSGNLVIWAYVTQGTSKKGLPGWKMFRVDRIRKVKPNPNSEEFSLDNLPEYVRGKAPGLMKSLSSVDVFSPYVSGVEKTSPSIPVSTEPAKPSVGTEVKPETEKVPPEEVSPEIIKPEGTIESPNMNPQKFDSDVLSTSIRPKVKTVNGEKVITTQDYQNAIDFLFTKKDGEWKNYQRKLSGNIRAGEGTRERFRRESKNEVDYLLSKEKVKISDNLQNQEQLSEEYKRFKILINL